MPRNILNLLKGGYTFLHEFIQMCQPLASCLLRSYHHVFCCFFFDVPCASVRRITSESCAGLLPRATFQRLIGPAAMGLRALEILRVKTVHRIQAIFLEV